MKKVEAEKPTAEELAERMKAFAISYYLISIRNDRDAYYALTPEDLKRFPSCIYGIFVNQIMDGNLDKVDELIASMEPDSYFQLAMQLVHPRTTMPRFLELVRIFKERKLYISQVILTAGRPFLLNGFFDFTRLGMFLERDRERFIENLQVLYEQSTAPDIYTLCLAEYYYQQNRVFDAEVLVSRTIKEFDKAKDSRLLFVALYLQSKILLVHGKIVDAGSYVKNIRKFVKKKGETEFSCNIDAAEMMTALYEGNLEAVDDWLATNAPDEFANFSMLDLYRYMVKIRCYIVKQEYAAVKALAEKLRPLLEDGHRKMDLCELDLLLSVCFYRSGEKEAAFDALERALKIVRRFKFYRLVADEGYALLYLLIDYIKAKGKTEFLLKLIEMTRSMAIRHPLYLKPDYKIKVKFTKIEVNVLKLLEQGKTIEELSRYLLVSDNTVKFHLKDIYKKLNVNTAHQAVWTARISGVI